MTFNPQEHLISLKGKKYLQVTHRLVWFRETHPQGSIITETISLDPIVFKATILDNEGRVIGTGHGSANAKPGAVWSGREVEKAETAAIGRALATAGFGTQFAEGFDDDDYLADSPVESSQRPAATPPANENSKQRTSTSKAQNGASTGQNEPPFIEAGTTQNTTVKSVEIVDKDGRPRLRFTCDDDQTALAFSRQMFIERGWIEDTEWKNLGSHKFKNRIPIERVYHHIVDDTGEIKGGYWEVTAVGEVVF